jgi:hypothetical protein
MPLNKIPKLREPRGSVVQQVRDLFLEREFKAHPEEYYLEDVKLVEQMDFLVQRYVIMQRKDVEASVKMLSSMLKWRKEKKLYDLRMNHFPQELTLVGGAFLYEPDKYGNRTLYLRASLCKNCAELKSSLRDFLTFLMFKLDDPKDGATYSVIMDLTNTTLTNYDIDLLTHVVALLKDYFPVNMDYFLAINFPWILSAAWSLIKRLIPAEKRDAVQFISSDKIFDFVSEENCPDFLGGKCTKPYSFIDPDAPNTIEYLQQHTTKPIPNKRLREILNLFNDCLPKEHMLSLRKQIEQMKDGIKVIESNNNNGSDENLNEKAVYYASKSYTNII